MSLSSEALGRRTAGLHMTRIESFCVSGGDHLMPNQLPRFDLTHGSKASPSDFTGRQLPQLRLRILASWRRKHSHQASLHPLLAIRAEPSTLSHVPFIFQPYAIRHFIWSHQTNVSQSDSASSGVFSRHRCHSQPSTVRPTNRQGKFDLEHMLKGCLKLQSSQVTKSPC